MEKDYKVNYRKDNYEHVIRILVCDSTHIITVKKFANKAIVYWDRSIRPGVELKTTPDEQIWEVIDRDVEIPTFLRNIIKNELGGAK